MNVLSLVETATQARNGSKLFRWAQDCRAEGHAVTPLVIDGSRTVADTAALIDGLHPDHVQIWGKVPIPQVVRDPDGHGLRPGACDAPYATASLDGWGWDASTGTFGSGWWPTTPVRSVSRVYFDDMPILAPDPYLAMDTWLDRNHAYRTGTYSYDQHAALVDYLDYLFPGLKDRLIADMASAVGGADRVVTLNAPTDSEVYHWFSVNRGKSFLVGALYDGGSSRGGDDGGVGEYNTGREADFASGNVPICVLMMYCSYGWQWDVWPIQRAALLGGSQFVLYDPAGYVPLGTWDEQTPIAVAVKRSQTLGLPMIDCGIGDGTIRRVMGVNSDMSQTDIDALHTLQSDFAAFKAQVIAAVPALQSGGGGTGVVVLSAHYRQVAHPEVFVDVTAAVQVLASAGRPWSVHPGLADPYVGILKELWVSWTRDGAPHTQVFSQLQQVVL